MIRAEMFIPVSDWLSRRSKTGIFLLGCVIIAVLGFVDYLTGPFSFLIFYLIPVALITWFGDGRLGVVGAVLCSITWFLDEAASAKTPFIPYWDLAVSFSFLVLAVSALSLLKAAFTQVKEFALYDYLTKAANTRFFAEIVQKETDRAKRHKTPLSLVYLDIDNFKRVNDTRGHQEGDRVLQAVVEACKRSIRKVDIPARIGGDEFAILLPETDAAGSKIAVERIRENIRAVAEEHTWPVTASIGVITCGNAFPPFDELLQQADKLMYVSKNGGKNKATYGVWDG